MQLPIELKTAIENQITDIKHNELKDISKSITDKYRNESGRGKRLISKEAEAVTYSVVRMPATFGAVYSALDYTLDLYDDKINTLLDIGAGTGAASWAADSLINLEKVVCLEREEAMRKVGQKIMKESESEALINTEWKSFDLTNGEIEDKGDLVIASYVLNELSDDERIKAVSKLWNATNKVLLIVEPGTKVGFSNLKKIRKQLIESGANIIAPCPHEKECEIDSWCHFTCRIPRSKLHKEVKNGDVPYEDEKFSYIAVSKEDCRKTDMRILRHPIIKKGRVNIEVCCDDGIKNIELYKKDKEAYKQARKADWGDGISK
ncbi:Ribosomal protein RSM22 (predicted rRNA methylase) [Clostridium sp. DSM 8431]|uniref:small ribosomal subunit Rsm22 family protein n=1 Tax=Clostridium sp. DSM 8431 TaxID=1761781 RepID=UPI0008E65F6F|nr:small ribosomal subunit Rsm22 family protein [Clostridium sp. DSM 8431]SFU43740.1 Ribosomal protein RSM22 (predicted rRNA methylase) [Clostridium sp. DSM 8431]